MNIHGSVCGVLENDTALTREAVCLLYGLVVPVGPVHEFLKNGDRERVRHGPKEDSMTITPVMVSIPATSKSSLVIHIPNISTVYTTFYKSRRDREGWFGLLGFNASAKAGSYRRSEMTMQCQLNWWRKPSTQKKQVNHKTFWEGGIGGEYLSCEFK